MQALSLDASALSIESGIDLRSSSLSLICSVAMEALIANCVEEVCQMHRVSPEEATAMMGRMLRLPPELERLKQASSSPGEYLSALDRAVQLAAKRLAALTPQLDRVLRRSSTDSYAPTEFLVQVHIHSKLMAACALLGGLADACVGACHGVASNLSAATRQALCSCASLVLGPGRAALEGICGCAELEPAYVHMSMRMQTSLLASLLHLAAQSEAEAVAFADRTASPGAFLPWLAAAARRAAAVSGAALGTGASTQNCRLLGSIIAGVLTNRSCKRHAAAVEQDLTLQRSLLPIMQQNLRTISVVASLPADRRPQAFDWNGVGNLVSALAGDHFHAAVVEHLQAVGSGSSAAWRMLENAATLLAHLPQDCQEGMLVEDHADLWYDTTRLLGMSCSFLVHWGPPDQQQGQRTVAQLRLAVLRLGESLQTAASTGEAPAAAVAEMWQDIVSMLWRLAALPMPAISTADTAAAGGAAAAATLEEVPAWCNTAVAMLRVLPQLGEMMEAAAQLPEELQAGPAEVFLFLAQAAASIAAACDAAVDLSNPNRRSDPTPAAVQAAADGVWQLHAALCRTTHWGMASASGSGSSSFGLGKPLLLGEKARRWLLGALADSRSAGDNLDGWLTMLSGGQGHAVTRDSPIHRQLWAMGAAHLEAVAALVRDASPEADREALQLSPAESATVAQSMLGVLTWCSPAVLLLSEPLQQRLCALTRASTTPGDASASVADSIRVLATLDPGGVAGALLLERGALDALLSALADSAAAQSAAQHCQKVSLWASLLVSLLTNILQATARLPAPAAAAQLGVERTALQAALEQSGIPGAWTLAGQQRVSAEAARRLLHDALPPARRLAAALLDWHRQPQQLASVRLEVARAAAARSCAYLCCASLGLEGGPAAGEGSGCKRCSACRAIWYCGTYCSHADWRAVHRRVCKKLAEELQRARH